MRLRRLAVALMTTGLVLGVASETTYAAGGGSGPKSYNAVGKIGAVRMNPYDLAPLTAIIMNGGYKITGVSVSIAPKGPNGVALAYRVSDRKVLNHGGIPVWGLYPDHVNKVEVTYDRHQPGPTGSPSERITETYSIYAPPVSLLGQGVNQTTVLPKAVVVTPAAPALRNNLYLMNHLSPVLPNASQAVWNNPAGGALEWDYESYVWIVDTNGDIRWYMKTDVLRDPGNVYRKGNMMGFFQGKDGALLWGMSQRYMKYDLMGREIFNRVLPRSYQDFSHHAEETPNGTFLLRVASSDFKRRDGKNVRTVRDVIVEVDRDGNVVDEWRLAEILDPYRDVNLKAMDQGAVCLNIDADAAGKTMSQEQLEDPNAGFGDITGVGPGRNWAHVNSVSYDAADDSIILSVRNQSATVKIGRDKQVKWILSSPEGWKGELAKKVLTPVDLKGGKLDCQGSKCNNTDFDWSWVQHTSYKVNEKSRPGALHVTTFDNGDSRGNEQPALPTQKYSRAVEYVIDEKAMTVKQVWEFGKERGFAWYSPITSVTQYQAGTDSMFVYSAVAGMGDVKALRAGKVKLEPWLHEFKYGTKTPLLEMKFTESNTIGYRSLKVDLQSAFR
jgi:arylsulfate sulfotransferase